MRVKSVLIAATTNPENRENNRPSHSGPRKSLHFFGNDRNKNDLKQVF